MVNLVYVYHAEFNPVMVSLIQIYHGEFDSHISWCV